MGGRGGGGRARSSQREEGGRERLEDGGNSIQEVRDGREGEEEESFFISLSLDGWKRGREEDCRSDLLKKGLPPLIGSESRPCVIVARPAGLIVMHGGIFSPPWLAPLLALFTAACHPLPLPFSSDGIDSFASSRQGVNQAPPCIID